MLTGLVNAEYLHLFLFFCTVLKQLHPLAEDFVFLQVVMPKWNAFLNEMKEKLWFGAEQGERKTHSLDCTRQGATCFNF